MSLGRRALISPYNNAGGAILGPTGKSGGGMIGETAKAKGRPGTYENIASLHKSRQPSRGLGFTLLPGTHAFSNDGVWAVAGIDAKTTHGFPEPVEVRWHWLDLRLSVDVHRSEHNVFLSIQLESVSQMMLVHDLGFAGIVQTK